MEERCVGATTRRGFGAAFRPVTKRGTGRFTGGMMPRHFAPSRTPARVQRRRRPDPVPVLAALPRRGLALVRREPRVRLPLSARLGWFDELIGINAGSISLLAGAPGGRKSGFATQVALDLGAQGVRTLTIMNEEAPDRLLERAVLLTGDWPGVEAGTAMQYMEFDAGVSDLEQLPGFLLQNVLGPNSRYAGTRLIILDSIQGDGTPAHAVAKYQRLFEFNRLAKAAGIGVLLIGHVNKRGQLAGPKDLEHHVDTAMRIEKVADFRVFAVTKNRYGPEHPRGVPLVIDPVTTALRPSPYREPVTGIARTFVSKDAEAEIQAQVSLPSPGSRPQIQAPGLPRRRIEQVVAAITRVPLLGIEQLDLHIGALAPGDATYRATMGLPLAVALIASCLRRPVPPSHMFLGEIDLTRSLRPLPGGLVEALSVALMEGNLSGPLRLIVPAASDDLPKVPGVEVVRCPTLDAAILHLWPDIH